MMRCNVKYHLSRMSRNVKTGPMPVSTISQESCPNTCPFKNGGGCYAEGSFLGGHWRKVTAGTRGVEFDEFLDQVRALPRGQIWRHAQAGDLPGVGDEIDGCQLDQLIDANRSQPVIAYTHKPLTEGNRVALDAAKNRNFHINISTEHLSDADAAIDMGYSAVTVISHEYQRGKEETLTDFKARAKGLKTPSGRPVAICPATYTDTSCLDCQACAKPRARDAVIAFPAHGSKKKQVSNRVST